MTMLASQITSLTVVCSIVYSCVNQGKHQSSASLAFVWEIHRGPVNSPHKGPVTRKMFPFDDVIMTDQCRATTKEETIRIRFAQNSWKIVYINDRNQNDAHWCLLNLWEQTIAKIGNSELQASTFSWNWIWKKNETIFFHTKGTKWLYQDYKRMRWISRLYNHVSAFTKFMNHC